MKAKTVWFQKNRSRGSWVYGLIALLLMSFSLGAQDGSEAEKTLRRLPTGPSEEFFQPLVDAFGANLNTGWVNLSPEAMFLGLKLKVGIVGMGAFVDPDEEVFQLLDVIFPFQEGEARAIANSIPGLSPTEREAVVQSLLDPNSPNQLMADVTGPNFFGPEDQAMVVTVKQQTITVNNQTYVVPQQQLVFNDVRGIIQDPGIFPTVAPQLSIGTVYGTQATLRWLPNITLNDEVGELGYFGFGIQHNPAVWFEDPLPVDIGLSFFTQKLNIGGGDVLDVTTTAFGFQLSKTFGGFVASLTPYGGFLLEKSEMKANYDYEIAPGIVIPIEFELEGANKNRVILGVGASIVGLNAFLDFNISEVNTVNFTVMYGF